MRITKELIERYHAGQCSGQERYAVKTWLESDEAELSFPEQADIKAMEDKGWKKISGRYHITAGRENNRSKFRNYRLSWQLAACVTAVVTVAVFYNLSRLSHQKGEEKSAQNYKEVKAHKGQKLTIDLPDGTVVQLNSESTLRFPAKFAAASRQVELKGEAFFSVTKDPSSPFSIGTLNTRITVLGTRFNLRAYPSEAQTSVVVEEGRVRFSGKTDSLILTANQLGVLRSGSAMQMKEVSAESYLAWKDNKLVFENESLESIVKTLERWYAVQISIKAPAIARERYTGKFDHPNLKTVLESMSFALDFNYRLKDNIYVIY